MNPRLTIAHEFYASLEADIGGSPRAIVRLLGEAARHGNDPELFAGLVHACRYGGLFEQSIAAHTEARRLDPNVPTSIEQTLLMTDAVDGLLALEVPAVIAGGDDGIRVIALGLAGRRDEALERLRAMRESPRVPAFAAWIDYLLAWLERRRDDMHALDSAFSTLKIQDDPEAIFQEGRLLCDIGDFERGLELLRRGVARGYYPLATLARSRQFDALRGDPGFKAIVAEAAAGRDRALAAFRNAGGERLLGS